MKQHMRASNSGNLANHLYSDTTELRALCTGSPHVQAQRMLMHAQCCDTTQRILLVSCMHVCMEPALPASELGTFPLSTLPHCVHTHCRSKLGLLKCDAAGARLDVHVLTDDRLVVDACPPTNGGAPADDAVRHARKVLHLPCTAQT